MQRFLSIELKPTIQVLPNMNSSSLERAFGIIGNMCSYRDVQSEDEEV